MVPIWSCLESPCSSALQPTPPVVQAVVLGRLRARRLRPKPQPPPPEPKPSAPPQRKPLVFAGVLALVAALLALQGCGGSEALAASDDELRAPSYVDAIEWLSAHGQLTPWLEARQALRADFEALCGDVWCEGDYADLRPLDLHCAVSAKTGELAKCTWAFAGSRSRISGSTGALQLVTRTWECPLPLHGSFTALVQAFSQPDPLHAALPGGGTLYDALGPCNLGH